MALRFTESPAFADADKACPVAVAVRLSRMDFPTCREFRFGKTAEQFFDRFAVRFQLKFKSRMLHGAATALAVKWALRFCAKFRRL